MLLGPEGWLEGAEHGEAMARGGVQCKLGHPDLKRESSKRSLTRHTGLAGPGYKTIFVGKSPREGPSGSKAGRASRGKP